jgi:putative salt-induced outer membrane protein YdiY
MFESSEVLCVLFMVCLAVPPTVVNVCRADDWSPPPPTGDDGFDWIELKSGEWLKGHIKSMQQEDLEFDSEELDIHVWDWEDIRTVRSPRLLSMRFGKDKVIDGSLLVTKDEAKVVNNSGTHAFPRAELLAIAPTGNLIRDKWSIDASFGMSARKGNTNELVNNTHVTLRRLTPMNRQLIEYLGNYAELEGEVSKDDQRWLANSDFFMSDRFFIRVPDFEYFHDSQQNLAHRITIGGSAGYDFIKTPRTEWQVTAGPAFQRSTFDSVESGTSATDNSAALVVGSMLEMELTKRLDLTLEYRGQFTGGGGGNNVHHTVSTLEFEIHKHLTLDISLIWDRISAPEPRNDGVTPKPDDFQLITALGFHF